MVSVFLWRGCTSCVVAWCVGWVAVMLQSCLPHCPCVCVEASPPDLVHTPVQRSVPSHPVQQSRLCTLPVVGAGMCSASATSLELAAAARPCCPCQQSLSFHCYSLCADSHRVTAMTAAVSSPPGLQRSMPEHAVQRGGADDCDSHWYLLLLGKSGCGCVFGGWLFVWYIPPNNGTFHQ